MADEDLVKLLGDIKPLQQTKKAKAGELLKQLQDKGTTSTERNGYTFSVVSKRKQPALNEEFIAASIKKYNRTNRFPAINDDFAKYVSAQRAKEQAKSPETFMLSIKPPKKTKRNGDDE